MQSPHSDAPSPKTLPEIGSEPRPLFWPSAFALAALLVIIYTLSNSGGFHIIDEASRFAVTESVALRGTVDTNAIAWTQWVNSPREAQGDFGPNGDIYSKKGPAQPLLSTLWYLLLLLPTRYLAIPALSSQLESSFGLLQWSMLFSGVITAATAVLIWRTAVRMGYPERAGALLALLFGLATIAWPYATYLLAEPLSALSLLTCFYALLRWRNQLYQPSIVPEGMTSGAPAITSSDSTKWLWIAGLAGGFAVATTIVHVLLLVVFGLYWLFLAWPALIQLETTIPRRVWGLIRWAIPLGFPLMITFGLMVLYNIIRFGIFWNTGYQIFDGEFFITPIWEGIWGLLFSPYRSFFLHSPIFIISLFAFPLFYKAHRLEALTVLGITIVILALYGKWWMWWGGYAWGPRFLVSLGPFWVLLLAPLLRRWFFNRPVPQVLDAADRKQLDSIGMVGALLLILLSVGVQLSAVVVNFVNFETELRGIFPTDWLEPLKYGPPATSLADIRYSPIVGQWILWNRDAVANTDLAWLLSNGEILWPVVIAGGVTLLLVAGLFRVGWLSLTSNGLGAGASSALVYTRRARWSGWISLVIAFAFMVVWAGQVSSNPRYGTENEGYRAILETIDQENVSDDAIITVAPYHYPVAMNWFQSAVPIYGYATDSLQYAESQLLLDSVIRKHPRIWFVTAGLPPSDPNNTIEHWLAQVSYKADDQWYNDFRLVRYATPFGARRLQESVINETLADPDNTVAIHTVAAVVEAKPAEILPVEIAFRLEESGGHNLRWFVQLLNGAGELIAANDTGSQGGYRSFVDMPPGEALVERIGLQLPSELSSGEYSLIVGLYNLERDGARLVTGDGGDYLNLGVVTIP